MLRFIRFNCLHGHKCASNVVNMSVSRSFLDSFLAFFKSDEGGGDIEPMYLRKNAACKIENASRKIKNASRIFLFVTCIFFEGDL